MGKCVQVGLDATSLDALNELRLELPLIQVSNTAEFEAFDESPPEDVQIVFCGSGIEGLAIDELAQSVRMNFPSAPVVYVSADKSEYRHDDFIKNGFTEAFLLPLDLAHFQEFVEEHLSKEGEKLIFKGVRLYDLEPETHLGFDLYLKLPANRKYVKYIASDGTLSKEQYERLNQKQQHSGYVRREEMSKFYGYTAERLKRLATGGRQGMSETERQERLKNSVRSVFTRIFDTSVKTAGDGKAIVEEAKGIIDAYIRSSPQSEIYKRVLQQIATSENNYSHMTNVSVYASLFSMATGIGEPEDLAVAGMLHNIGESEVPFGVYKKKPSEMTFEEQTVYSEHPSLSLKVIQDKKLVVSDAVRKAILQHHERLDGSGYPKGLRGNAVSLEAQLIGLADEFDELTRPEEGRVALKPAEAIHRFRDGQKFSLEIIGPLLSLF